MSDEPDLLGVVIALDAAGVLLLVGIVLSRAMADSQPRAVVAAADCRMPSAAASW
ncbi:hypothetical protein [Micromonospora sp. NPDC048839]|uniref:hypothetical protein n=1 Tax=Micromonospora sp. NPDC048839 TaxID=3155641 RepID=UPI0033CCC6F8